MSKIQSIIFSRKKWNPAIARKWLIEHNFKCKKIDVKPLTLRYRQHEPGTFKRFRVKTLNKGIKLIIGFYNKKRVKKTL